MRLYTHTAPLAIQHFHIVAEVCRSNKHKICVTYLTKYLLNSFRLKKNKLNYLCIEKKWNRFNVPIVKSKIPTSYQSSIKIKKHFVFSWNKSEFFFLLLFFQANSATHTLYLWQNELFPSFDVFKGSWLNKKIITNFTSRLFRLKYVTTCPISFSKQSIHWQVSSVYDSAFSEWWNQKKVQKLIEIELESNK